MKELRRIHPRGVHKGERRAWFVAGTTCRESRNFFATLQDFESKLAAPQLDTLESLRSALEAKGVEFVREQIGAPLKILV